jgi:protein ImuB
VALAPLPIRALRLDQEPAATLEALGIDRIEPLYALPRQALAARFGRQVLTRLEQALGLIDEPIAADAPLPAQQAQLIFADPIMTADQLLPSITRLVRQLAVGLEAAGLGARRLALALYRVDGSTALVSIGSRDPSRHVDRLSRRLGEKVVAIDPGFGFERAILDAAEIEPLLPETIAWRGLGTGDVLPMRDLAFGAKKGAAGRHRPAACCAEVPRAPAWREDRPGVVGNLAAARQLAPLPVEEPALDEQPQRSLRLLRQPEPIEAIAPLPDEPPILFRWRQGLHTIVRAQGPERVAPDWWRIPGHEQPSIGHELASRLKEERRLRDYFAVEDSAGDRFWLFREGLYQASQKFLPRWYLHGLFR